MRERSPQQVDKPSCAARDAVVEYFYVGGGVSHALLGATAKGCNWRGENEGDPVHEQALMRSL